MAQKKKIEWKFWILILVVAMIAAYYICGLVKLPGVTLDNASEGMSYILLHPFKNWWNEYSKYALLGAFSAWICGFSYYLSNNKNFMFGREYGSAEWADIQKFNRDLADYDGKKKPQNINKNNRVLSQNARISYNSSYTLLNNNQIIVGGSGAGKTAYQIAPNIFQFHGSNVYTDPKGDTLATYGKYMEEHGMLVKSINLCDMRESAQYNPFKYIRNQQDLQKLITNLIANTTPPESHSNDPFWEKAETLYLTAIFAYVWKCCPRDDEIKMTRKIKDSTGHVGEIIETKMVHLDRNFRTVLMLLGEAEVPANENEDSPLTKRMKALADDLDNNPLGEKHIAVRNYYKCIRGAGDTVRSIIISANARFSPFDNEDLLRILDDDDIDLGSLGIGVDGDQKTQTALFCIIPDDDTTFNFVIGMLYTQLFQELYRLARYYGGKLPIDVGFWLDEFANIKMPDAFDKILATCRSRGIYCTVVLQNLAQIKADYEKKWESIIGNCDTFIYLGGNEDSTHEYISKKLGKWTIDKRSNGRTLGQHGSSSRTDDILGRELMTQDEVAHMDNDYCIVFVRGQNPIYDRKWFLWTSKEYKDAKSLGEFHFLPDIREDKVTGRLTTIKEKGFGRVLSKESMEYFKGAISRGENIEFQSESLLDFLSADFDLHEESDDSVREQLLKNWDACEKRLEERNEEIRRINEAAAQFDQGIAEPEEIKEADTAEDQDKDKVHVDETVKQDTVKHYESAFDAMCDPAFDDDQVKEIKQGIIDGLSDEDILKYAVVENTARMMATIRRVLQTKEAG